MKLVVFVMPGYPTLADSLETVAFLQTQENVIIETSLPKKNEAAKGIIRHVHQQALKNDVIPKDVFQAFRQIQASFLMLSKTPDAKTLQKIRGTFDTALFPATPAMLRKLNAPRRTHFAAKVRPGQKNLEAVVRAARGFVYLQCAPERAKSMYPEKTLWQALQRIHSTKKIPVFAGYGVKTRADIQKLERLGADGVVLGSQSVRHQAQGPNAFKKWFLNLRKRWRQTRKKLIKGHRQGKTHAN